MKVKCLAAALLALIMVSCDSNKGKVKEVAAQFAAAVAAKDKVVINELYPNAKTYSVLQLVDTINADNLEVEYDETDSVYIAKYNDKQKVVFKVTGENDVTIMDSYNILKLDSSAYELAAKVSAPVLKQSDLKNGELFADDSPFMEYLSAKYPNASNGNLYHANGRYSWRGGSYCTVQFDLPVTNGGDASVKGEDYTMEVVYTNRETGERIGTSVENGVDLTPSETYVYTIWKNELFNAAKNSGIYCYVTFKFKNASVSTMLARYGSFTGKEYDEFVKEMAEAEAKPAEGEEGKAEQNADGPESEE